MNENTHRILTWAVSEPGLTQALARVAAQGPSPVQDDMVDVIVGLLDQYPDPIVRSYLREVGASADAAKVLGMELYAVDDSMSWVGSVDWEQVRTFLSARLG